MLCPGVGQFYSTWSILNILNVQINSFHQIYKVLGHYFFKYFLCSSFSPLLLKSPCIRVMACLMVSLKSLSLYLFMLFFSLLFPRLDILNWPAFSLLFFSSVVSYLLLSPSEVKWRSEVKSLSRVRLFAIPWTAAYQAPPSMGFSRQEYWSGLPFPSSGDLPERGLNPALPHSRQTL